MEHIRTDDAEGVWVWASSGGNLGLREVHAHLASQFAYGIFGIGSGICTSVFVSEVVVEDILLSFLEILDPLCMLEGRHSLVTVCASTRKYYTVTFEPPRPRFTMK